AAMKFAWTWFIWAGVQVPLIRLAMSETFHCRLPSRACSLDSIDVPGWAASPSSSVANASSPRPVTLVIVPLFSLASLTASFCELVAALGEENRYTLKLAVATAVVVPPSLCCRLNEQLALPRYVEALRSARGAPSGASNDLARSPTATLSHMLSGSEDSGY